MSDSVVPMTAKLVHVITVVASLFAVTLAVNMEVPLYRQYADVSGYSEGVIAIAFGAYIVGLIPVLTFLGGVSDRIGRKQTLFLSLLVSLAANVFIISFPNMEALMIVRAMNGVAVGLCVGASASYFLEAFGRPSKATLLNGVVVALGLGVGSLLTTASLWFVGGLSPYSYYLITLLTVVCLVAVVFVPNITATRDSHLLRLPFYSRSSIPYCLAIFFAWSMVGIVIAATPSELQRLGYDSFGGVITFLAIGTGAFFQLYCRHLPSEFSIRVGYVLMIASFFLLILGVWFASIVLILISALLAGASGFGFIYLGGMSAVMTACGNESARAVSGFLLFAYLGLGIPCILVGFLAEEFGLLNALIGVFTFVGVVGALAKIVKTVFLQYLNVAWRENK